MPASTRLGPVEGWLVRSSTFIGFIKGCFHPLPRLRFIPRLVSGVKTWDAGRAVKLLENTNPGLVDEDPCTGHRVALVDPGREGVELVSPLAAAAALEGCRLPICRAALELLTALRDGGVGLVGVTGGLAYDPRKASDIDVVVYGQEHVDTAYQVLAELRREGVTGEAPPRGHGWTALDRELALAARGRLLLGLYKGYEYNVRLVPCTRPAACTRVHGLGMVRLKGRICGGVNYTTPAFYRLCSAADSVVAVVVTYRLRYMELPDGLPVEVYGRLEEWCGGGRYVVPDMGGYVRLLSHRPRDWG